MNAEPDYYEEESNSFDLGQILAIAKRRFLFFLIPAVLIGVIAVAAAFLLPPRYESSGTVLVESQQIPVELVQSTVTSDPNQRITTIRQRVMTRANLLRIIDKYKVFVDERKKLSVTKLIEEMQSLIQVDVIRAGNNSRGPTIAFKVSFQHESPVVAAKVANELVTLFLSENVKTRTARATETTEFLEQEAKKLKAELLTAETAISDYKKTNNENLPEHLNLRLARLERTKTEIQSVEDQIRALREEQRYLDVELAAALSDNESDEEDAEALSESQKELDKLKDLLIDASVRLTDAHPDIKSLKRRIAALEAKIKSEQEASAENGIERKSLNPVSPKTRRLIERLRIRVSSTKENIAKHQTDLVELREKATDIEERIIKTPEVERELITLTRNHREIFEKYTELQNKQGKAQLAQNLEEEKKAERFILLEPPITPTEPVWPNRLKIGGIGGFLAFAAGIGTAFLIELVDKRIRTAAELEKLLRHPPLASIPYLKTDRDVKKKRYKVGIILFLPVTFGIIAIACLHLFYKPLDILFYRAWVYLEKLSVTLF